MLDGEEAVARLREAVEVLAATPARLEHARAQADLGAALRRSGEPAEARGPLTEALAVAQELGAVPLVERIDYELGATGARRKRAERYALSGPDALTPSERRVAQMAVDGLTNREIAQALFLTRKTIEMHLHNAYGKLGIASRAELPRRCRERLALRLPQTLGPDPLLAGRERIPLGSSASLTVSQKRM